MMLAKLVQTLIGDLLQIWQLFSTLTSYTKSSLRTKYIGRRRVGGGAGGGVGVGVGDRKES